MMDEFMHAAEPVADRIKQLLARSERRRAVFLRPDGAVNTLPAEDVDKIPLGRLVGVYDARVRHEHLHEDIAYCLRTMPA